jgi:hypothetical protein
VWGIAAEAATEPSQTLIGIAFGFLGTVVMTLGTIVVAVVKIKYDRSDRVESSPPSADTRTAERVAVLEHLAREGQERNDDSDERDDMQDRAIYSHDDRLERHHGRLSAIERWADRHDPGWRSP